MISPEEIYDLYQTAASHYNAGNLEEAQRICNIIINSGPHGDTYNILAHIAHENGEYEKSISLMHSALQLYKKSSIYNNNMGNLLFKQGKVEAASEFFKKAILYKPDFVNAHFNLALVELNLGNHEKALQSFQKTIQLKPDTCDAHTNIGNIYMALNKPQEASESYWKALDLKPGDIVISVNLGLALQALQKQEEAMAVLQNALTDSPDNAVLLFHLGNLNKSRNDINKSIKYFQKALERTPDDPIIHYNLGTIFMETGQYADASTSLETSLKLNPENPQALNNMGMVQYNMGNYTNALESYQKALELYPDFAEVHNNIGLVYKYLEQTEKSMDHFRKAIKANANFGEAFYNLAEVQRESHQFDEAVKNSSRAIELQPDLTPAYSHHAYLLKWLCEWNEYDRIEKRLDHLVTKELERKESVRETPFMNVIRVDDAAYNRKVADHFASNVSQNIKNMKLLFPFEERSPKNNKITIGYLSSNFRYHPLAHLLANLFKHHNRNEFRINCYSMGPDDGSEYRKRFMEDSDLFRDIRHISHGESAQQIFDDNVDILVDLMGYTQGNRLEISALRPAPVQVRYMGMPGTTGGEIFDYILVDEIVLPRDQQIHYAEKFIYMPHTYQINDRSKKISREPVTREMFGLPENSFVFCSFNTSYKIDPIIFSAWMGILQQTENSVLWLMPDIQRAWKNMRTVAEQHGVDPNRLVYADNIPLENHLARISLADLALDTRTVGGAATTSDALWGGTPVITLRGNRFISRMSASILSAIGLDELITDNIDGYKRLAVKLAKEEKALGKIKQKLNHNIQSMPLFDTLGFTLNLEKAFKKIWDLHCSDEEKQLIDLKDNIDRLTTAAGLYSHEYESRCKRISIN